MEMIKISKFTERNLNYWTYCFTYDKYWFEILGESDYGFNSLFEVYKAILEDKKDNERLMKSELLEPKCYYHAMFYEWSEDDQCYYYTEYSVSHRRLKNGKVRVYAKEVD